MQQNNFKNSTKTCRLCAQKIPASAKVCFHCQLHQGFFRRNTAFWLSLISLLVALSAIANSGIQTFSTAIMGNTPRFLITTPEIHHGMASGFEEGVSEKFKIVLPVFNDGDQIIILDPSVHCSSGQGEASRGVEGPNFLDLRRKEAVKVDPKTSKDIIWGWGDWIQLDVSSGGFYAGSISEEFYTEVSHILSELFNTSNIEGYRSRMTLEFSCYLAARTFSGELALRSFSFRIQYQNSDD